MRHLHLVASVLFALLGVAHTTATPHFYVLRTPGAAWFASGGVTLILTGLLDLFARRHVQDRRGFALVHAANALMTLLIVYVTVVLPIPQAFVGLALVLAVAVSAFGLPREAARG